MNLIDKIIYRFTTDAIDNEVEFKINAKLKDQSYEVLCKYKVIGYWRYKHEFLWKSLGVIGHSEWKGYGHSNSPEGTGKWKEEYRSYWLNKAYKTFLSRRNDKILSIPIRQILEDIG